METMKILSTMNSMWITILDEITTRTIVSNDWGIKSGQSSTQPIEPIATTKENNENIVPNT